MDAIDIRKATIDDVPLLLRLIRGLAEYEKLSDKVTATESDLREHLFGPDAKAEAVIARSAGQPVGLAVYVTVYSTFSGKPGLYLEDLYVDPEYRGRGIGRRLISWVARQGAQSGCVRMNWSVLDWNEPALAFYDSLGAEPVKSWVGYSISGDAFQRLAGQD
jgi:GNAT superfamily N-acetyltransferase